MDLSNILELQGLKDDSEDLDLAVGGNSTVSVTC
jgi:hypothetical protein